MTIMEEQKQEAETVAAGETKPAQAETRQEKRPRRKAVAAKRPAKKEVRVVLVKSRRKSAVARASIRSGDGRISVNRSLIDVVQPEELRMLMLEPIGVSESTRSLAGSVDIKVTVMGGGSTARAEAVRGAIAKALAGFAGNDIIRKEYLRHDRSMIIDDSRRVEPKKFDGPKARARTQTSYR